MADTGLLLPNAVIFQLQSSVDDLTRSSSDGPDIILDECHQDTEQPFDDSEPSM